MAPSDTLLLQSILDRIASLDTKVEHIAEKQAVIAERVDSHIKASEPATKSWIMNALGVIKSWVFPIILAIFLLGRQSVEYTNKPMNIYPPKAVISSQVDDTFVANKNKKLDSIILKQITKQLGGD